MTWKKINFYSYGASAMTGKTIGLMALLTWFLGLVLFSYYCIINMKALYTQNMKCIDVIVVRCIYYFHAKELLQ